MNPVTASRFVTKGGVGYGVDETQKDRATADWEIPNVSLENGWSKNWIFKKKNIWNGFKWIKQWIFMDIPKQPTALVAFHCIFGYIVTTNQALLTLNLPSVWLLEATIFAWLKTFLCSFILG